MCERYCTLAKEADIAISSSFMSRRSTFKDTLAERTHGVYELVVLRDQTRTKLPSQSHYGVALNTLQLYNDYEQVQF